MTYKSEYHREKMREYHRLWREKHRKILRERCRKYRADNLVLCRERAKLPERKRRDKVFFGGNRQKMLVLKENKCEMCGDKDKRKIVHHKDENKNNNNISNLQVLCQSCHAGLHYVEDHRKHQKNGDFAPRGLTLFQIQ
jgi:hypothetical protein